MLGDSITAGYGLARGQALPARLEAALRARGRAVRVIDAGVSGDTTAGGRARLDWALAENPHAVIVALGGNDGLRALEPRASRANLAAILDALAAKNLPTMLTGILAPPNLGAEYGREFASSFSDLARERPGVVFYPFLLEGVAGDLSLNQPDGIHPNVAGDQRRQDPANDQGRLGSCARATRWSRADHRAHRYPGAAASSHRRRQRSDVCGCD